MRKILGLDLGVGSIGWAMVNEAESENERSSIIKLGVRVNPLTIDETINFEKGKSITTNADRTLKRSMRRNLQRYKLRRDSLIQILKEHRIICDETVLAENSNQSTFETYRLRAKAVTEEVNLEGFARILMMINKKRGYKSSRKAKSSDEGQLLDGMDVAIKLYEENLTPGQLCLQLLKAGKKTMPEFYRSDLNSELTKIWEYQAKYYPDVLTEDFKKQIGGKGKNDTSKNFLGRFGIYSADIKGTGKRIETFQLRSNALSKQITLEEVALVISEVNGNINSSSGYLGDISDRSKELYFKKITVGQYLMQKLDENPHFSLKNKVFYRQDYLDEFERIWETQAKYHPLLTPELKSEIRDVIIFYQRRLKSQKGLISFCEFESEIIEIEENGKKVKVTKGNRVCPRSSPLFQEFKIWQTLNNVRISSRREHWERDLDEEEKLMLAEELKFRVQLADKDVIKMLFPGRQDISINFKKLDGNKTISALYNVYENIIEMSGHDEVDFSKTTFSKAHEYVKKVFDALGFNTQILNFDFEGDQMDLDKHELYRLWHLLYSYEGDNSSIGNEGLIKVISNRYGFDKEYAVLIANVVFQDDYGSLSAKAISKILPFLKSGNTYDIACEYAGYRHSKNSLTKTEIEQKELLPKLDILPRNSLRNPVVEKILNQMINVINAIIEEYGKPDEVRIELARELKKSAKERESMTSNINKSNIEHERIRTLLISEFGLRHVSRNDIIRFKLYEELEFTGYKTLYSNTYIPREKLFSHEFDIDHIIPQSRLFDDSFSNKTLELKKVNIEKGNQTASDFVAQKYGEQELGQYHARLDNMLKNGRISPVKYKKLKMKGSDIPQDFIERDIRDTQYISKKAKTMLETIVRSVVSTGGSITDKLRQDWQLIDVMKELNWEKYDKLGMTEVFENEEGHQIRRIKDWTKRNDHRHHAMDALTVAFTKRSHIQYLNNLNARSDKSASIYGIEAKELDRNERGKLLFKPPIPLKEFRAEAKSHLESVLVSIKAKNKVMTKNVNKIRKHGGHESVVQLTPRGQLHNETIYGSRLEYVTKTEKVNAAFDKEKIQTVANKKYREALMKRLEQFENDPKLAFTGKNSVTKNPVWIDAMRIISVPEKVKLTTLENMFTIRKEISKDLNIDKVVDKKVRKILQERLDKYLGDANKAFSNLDIDPIWLNEEKGISIKRVTISGVSNAVALRERKDHLGNKIMDEQGLSLPVDFVSPSNNHHLAIYIDQDGNLQDEIVSFYEVVERKRQNQPIIDKNFKNDVGWMFLFSMKQNEYFLFPNKETGFFPEELNILEETNNKQISQNLYRVQKISKLFYGNSPVRDYVFRHHLETTVNDVKILKDITYKSIKSLEYLKGIVKVRVNHIGKIISVGDY